MTLLTAINAACDVVARDRFDTIINNTDAQQMLEYANEGGEEIGRRVDWAAMFATDTATATASHSLASDFQRLTPGGAIYTSAGVFARPVTNHGEWKIVTAVPSTQVFYFLNGTVVQFSPSGTYTINYVSTKFCQSGGATGQTAFAADDDVTRFPQRLLTKGIVWRWKRQNGLPYEDQLAEFEADIAMELKANRGVMS